MAGDRGGDRARIGITERGKFTAGASATTGPAGWPGSGQQQKRSFVFDLGFGVKQNSSRRRAAEGRRHTPATMMRFDKTTRNRLSRLTHRGIASQMGRRERSEPSARCETLLESVSPWPTVPR
jgi:hypothetical protein